MPTWITYPPCFGVKDAKRTVADAQNDPEQQGKRQLIPLQGWAHYKQCF